MADCRSLIEFLRAFEQHRLRSGSGSPVASAAKRGRFSNPLCSSPNPHSLCEHSAFAAVDVFLFLLAVGAVGFLFAPYLSLLFLEALSLVRSAPFVFAYAAGVTAAIAFMYAAYDFLARCSRKCGKPHCKGLKKAVEFDIQLETEECVRGYPTFSRELLQLSNAASRPMLFGEEHKELEAELRKMAPPNGRTVLILRSPCGCPKGRMEVWGPKKIRRIKTKFHKAK